MRFKKEKPKEYIKDNDDNESLTPKEILARAILQFSIEYSVWGLVFSRLRRVPDESMPAIMGVGLQKNGSIFLFYNPYMIKGTSLENIKKVLIHEGLHVLNKHLIRFVRVLSRKELNEEQKIDLHTKFQIAGDCCVNVQAKLPKQIEICGEKYKLVFPELFNLPPAKNMETYIKLLDKMEQKKKKEDKKRKEGEKDNKGKEGEEEGDKGKGDEGKGNKKNIDDHSVWTKDVKGVTDLSSLARKGEDAIRKIAKDIRNNNTKLRGFKGSEIEKLIDDLLEPPSVPYYEILRKIVRGSKLSKYKRHYTTINRKWIYTFDLEENSLPEISPFPGRKRDFTFTATIVLDTSGSMTKEEIYECFAGIRDLLENDKNITINVIEVDTDIKKEYKVKKLSSIDFLVKGGGGTILLPGLIRAKELRSDITICFTDGGCEDFTKVDRDIIPKRLVWVVTKPKNSSVYFTKCLEGVGYLVTAPDG